MVVGRKSVGDCNLRYMFGTVIGRLNTISGFCIGFGHLWYIPMLQILASCVNILDPKLLYTSPPLSPKYTPRPQNEAPNSQILTFVSVRPR